MRRQILQYCCLRFFRRRGHLVKLAFIVLLALPAYVLLLGKAPKAGLTLGEPGVEDSGDEKANYGAAGGQRQGGVYANRESFRNRERHIPAPPFQNDNNFDPKDLQQQRRRSLQDRDADLPKAAGVSHSLQPIIEVSGVRATYRGCFNDDPDKSQRALRDTFFVDQRRMSIALCLRYCHRRGMKFAGLEFRSECYCGQDIYQTKAENNTRCDLKCVGDASDICGGAPYISIYEILGDANGMGNSKDVKVWDASSSKVPSGIAEGFRACAVRPDGGTQIFSNGYTLVENTMTVTKCVNICMQKQFPMAALGRGRECHCGFLQHAFTLRDTVPSDKCNVPCSGANEFYCGGESFLSVYQTTIEDKRCTENIQLKPSGTFPLIALASFPGSGNTWVRYLIERATGIYTGSYYDDGDLFKKGFRGERELWTKGTTVVVKTHRFDEDHIRAYAGSVVIIRDPYKAIISEHNRKFGGHTGYAPEAQYKKGTEWIDFVTGKSRTWSNTAINFLQYSKKVLVIYYEDLQTDLYDNLVKIVNFLGLPVDENRLLCVLGNPHGKFKRPTDKKKQLTFDPFTDEMREIITLYVKAVSMALKLKNQQSLPSQYDPKLEL